MKALRFTTQFKKDLKRVRSRGYRLEKLMAIIDKLRSGEPLSPIDDDHPLKGTWDGRRDCHVQGDWCLIYKAEDDAIILFRTGTHSDLFR